jgi:putative restriction endonuclease
MDRSYNGLCLSAIFDRLFGAGLMTIAEDLIIRFSSLLIKVKNSVTLELLCCYNEKPIKKPYRFLPCLERLEWHHMNRFKR